MEHTEIQFSKLCNFTEKQLEATRAADKYQYHLYGGSRGPGKSYWLRWYLLREVLKLTAKGFNKPVVGLFCESYKALTDRQIGRISTEFPNWLGRVADGTAHGLGFYIKEQYGGGVIVLRNLDDPSKYQSAEFAAVGIDELTRIPEDTFHRIRGSLRWPNLDKPRFVAASNPGGIGHIWVRSYWIDRRFPPEMEQLASEFHFTPALPEDNPHLSKTYWQMLETLPPDLAQAWRYGSWDIFEGQFFSELSRQIHGFSGEPPFGWSFISIDYGEAAPSAVYWWRVDESGGLWAYRELYQAGLLYQDLKMIIRDMSLGEEIRYTVASPDIFQRAKGTGVVGAEVFASPEYGGFSWPVRRADNNRIEGWRQLKAYIHNRRIHISTDACPNFWRTVPAMTYDDTNFEDMADGEDHAAESARYAVMSRPRHMARSVEPIVPFSAAWAEKQFKEHDNVTI